MLLYTRGVTKCRKIWKLFKGRRRGTRVSTLEDPIQHRKVNCLLRRPSYYHHSVFTFSLPFRFTHNINDQDQPHISVLLNPRSCSKTTLTNQSHQGKLIGQLSFCVDASIQWKLELMFSNLEVVANLPGRRLTYKLTSFSDQKKVSALLAWRSTKREVGMIH